MTKRDERRATLRLPRELRHGFLQLLSSRDQEQKKPAHQQMRGLFELYL